MRKEKEIELQRYIDEYSTKSRIQVPNRPNSFLRFYTYDMMLNNGSMITREILRKGERDGTAGGDAAAILPITENKELIFVVQPRPAGVLLEIPAGYKQIGETILDAGFRELEEETGLIFDKNNIHKITDYYQDTGISTAKVHVYIAQNCTDTFKQRLDKDEHIRLFRCTIEEGKELYRTGRLEGPSSKLAFSMGKHLIK